MTARRSSGMRICGVDPGLQRTGYGVLDVEGPRMRLVATGVFRSSAEDVLAVRVQAIHAGVADLLRTTQPDYLALEALYSHYAHPATAILMGHVRGVILLAAGAAGVPVSEYSATHVKKAVSGRGHAGKSQVQRMIQMLLNLPAPPTPDDATDALAIAMAHAHALRAPLSACRPAGTWPTTLRVPRRPSPHLEVLKR